MSSVGVCRSHCSSLLRFLKNGMAPARRVNGQWQNVTISKSCNPSSAVRFVRDESGPPPLAAYRLYHGPTPEETEPLSGTDEVHPQLEDLGPNASLTDWTRYVLVCAEHLREHPPDDAPPDSMEQVLHGIYRRRQIRGRRESLLAAGSHS